MGFIRMGFIRQACYVLCLLVLLFSLALNFKTVPAKASSIIGLISLNTGVTGYLPISTNAQSSTTYTIAASDAGKIVTLCNVSPIAVSLPQATGLFTTGYNLLVENVCAGLVTVTPTTSTIDGVSTMLLGQNQGAVLISAGGNYTTLRGTFPLFNTTSNGFIGNNAVPVAPFDFSNTNLAFNAQQQIVFGDTLVQGTGLTDISSFAAVTITNGSLIGGGPTFRCSTCRWLAGSAGPDGTTAIILDFGTSYPIMGVTFGSWFRTGCTLGGVAIDTSPDNITYTNIGNPVYTCHQIALFGHGGFSGPVLGIGRYLRISYTVAGVSNLMAGLQVFTDSGAALWGYNPWGVGSDGASSLWRGSGAGGGGCVGIGILSACTAGATLEVKNPSTGGNTKSIVSLGASDTTKSITAVNAGSTAAVLFSGNDAAPTLTACGSGAAVAGTSTTTGGTVTEGSGATGCVVTFTTAPSRCVITSESGLVFTYTLSAAALTIINVGALSSTQLDWTCTL